MIKLTKIEGTDIYEFSIDGNITKESVEDFYKLLEIKATQGHKIKLLGTINQFPGFKNFKAFSSTLKMKIKSIRTLKKYAILSDRNWVETLLPAGNFLTPGIPMKHFSPHEREQAITWLKKDNVKTYSEEAYLSKMDINNIKGTNIYSFKLDGKIDEGGMTALYNILKNKTGDKKVQLLAYIEEFDGFTNFKSFTEGLKVDIASFGTIDKLAIVTNKKWINTIAEIESKIIPGITMKGFTENEKDNALAWLKEH